MSGTREVPWEDVLIAEESDLSPILCEHMDNKSLLALRATCFGGQCVVDPILDPRKVHERLGNLYNDRRFCPGTNAKLMALAKEGELRMLQVAHTCMPKYEHWGQPQCAAVEAGQLALFPWLFFDATPPLKTREVDDFFKVDVHIPGEECASAAAGGQLEALKWLRAQTPPFHWDGKVYASAIRHGHVHILEWAFAQSPPCPQEARTIFNYDPRHFMFLLGRDLQQKRRCCELQSKRYYKKAQERGETLPPYMEYLVARLQEELGKFVPGLLWARENAWSTMREFIDAHLEHLD